MSVSNRPLNTRLPGATATAAPANAQLSRTTLEEVRRRAMEVLAGEGIRESGTILGSLERALDGLDPADQAQVLGGMLQAVQEILQDGGAWGLDDMLGMAADVVQQAPRETLAHEALEVFARALAGAAAEDLEGSVTGANAEAMHAEGDATRHATESLLDAGTNTRARDATRAIADALGLAGQLAGAAPGRDAGNAEARPRGGKKARTDADTRAERSPEPGVQTRPPAAGLESWNGAPVNQNMVTTIRDPRVARVIEDAARTHGIDPEVAKAIAGIESSGRPDAGKNGTYKGLFQLSEAEFRKHGGTGNILDPRANAEAGMKALATKARAFEKRFGRPPTPTELYMAHQQGEGGLQRHLANPDGSAVQNMLATAEGRKKGIEWARRAVWGNIPEDQRRRFPGGVDTVTSRQFGAVWAQKLQGIPYEQSARGRDKVFGAFGPGSTDSPAKPAPRTGETPRANTVAQDAAWTDERTGRSFPSRDGVPLYAQGDREWGQMKLGGNRKNIHAAGCAISSCAMAVSRMSGQTVTPGEMDAYLDKSGGYVGDNVKFGQVGGAVKSSPPVKATRERNYPVSAIDKELAAGRPVVIGVHYKNSAATDHWMCITGKNKDGTYNVNDPAGGRPVQMHVKGGALVAVDGKPHPYQFTGDAVTFKGGNPAAVRKQPAPRNNADAREGVGRAAGAGMTGLDLASEFSSADSTLSVAIGNAEGTRTPTGGRTRAYSGHTDPGNGAANKGTFSYQVKQNKNVRTPEQADAAQLKVLKSRIPQFEAACRKAGVDANNPRLQAAFFDLSNQCSPTIWERFLERLPRLKGKPLTLENLVKARLDAMHDDNGRFTATGLKTPARAEADQRRRMEAMENVLQRNGAL